MAKEIAGFIKLQRAVRLNLIVTVLAQSLLNNVAKLLPIKWLT